MAHKTIARVLIAISLCVGTVIPVFASGQQQNNGSTTAAAQPTAVHVWSWRSQDRPLWQKVQKALQAKGDNIVIKFRPVEVAAYGSVLATALNGGAGPDVYFVGGGVSPVKYEASGQAKNIKGIVDLKQITAKAALEVASYKGGIYGVPYALETWNWYYNKKIFAKYNLTVPKTWAEFLHNCEVLKSHGVTPIFTMGTGFSGNLAAIWEFDTIAVSMLGPDFIRNLIDRKVKLTDPKYVDALKRFKELTKYYEPNWQAVGASGSAMDTNFALGKAAMIADGGFDVQPKILKTNPQLDLGEFMSPPLQSGQSPVQYWYADGYIAMNSSISNPRIEKATETLMNFAATPAFGTLLSGVSGEISPVHGSQIPSQFKLQRKAAAWIDSNGMPGNFDVNGGMGLPPAPSGKKVAPATSLLSFEISNLEAVLTGNMTPQEYAQKAQKAMSWYYSN